ncbi:unnamed protein product, partial [Brenthis ino]
MLTSISLPTFFWRKTTKFLLKRMLTSRETKTIDSGCLQRTKVKLVRDHLTAHVLFAADRSSQRPLGPPPHLTIHFCKPTTTTIIARSRCGDAFHNASR